MPSRLARKATVKSRVSTCGLPAIVKRSGCSNASGSVGRGAKQASARSGQAVSARHAAPTGSASGGPAGPLNPPLLCGEAITWGCSEIMQEEGSSRGLGRMNSGSGEEQLPARLGGSNREKVRRGLAPWHESRASEGTNPAGKEVNGEVEVKENGKVFLRRLGPLRCTLPCMARTTHGPRTGPATIERYSLNSRGLQFEQ